MDVLTDVLQTLRLRGTVYFHADFGAPWGMDINGGQVANFHAVTEGRCWVSLPETGWSTWLEAGDVILFPHGSPHVLASDPRCRPVPARQLLAGTDAVAPDPPVFGGGGATTRLICGHFERRTDSRHPLFTTLPPQIQLRRDTSARSPWFESAVRMAALESRGSEVGGPAIVDRLAEVLLIHILRAWSEEDSPEQQTFLRALADPDLATALELIHGQPLHPWSLEELAGRSGLSRSGLTARFRATVGVSPMRYLMHWRLERAYHGMSEHRWTIRKAAREAGYADEFSFSRAFKRVYGITPRNARAQAAS